MNFGLYFNLGIEHITDPNGYDHILFIIAMCANYRLRQWKNLAILVTAFTLGHSFSLALAMLEIVPVNSNFIEFLIPVTIMLSCITNIIKPQGNQFVESCLIPKNNKFSYLLILAFGIIHGLGFSNFLKETLVENESLFTPLLAFNIGLEVGQLLIVAIFLIFNFFFLEVLRKQARDWTIFISGAIASIAFLLIIEKAALLFGVNA